MPARDFILGLSLSGGGVQAVELERDGAKTTLLAIDEWEDVLSPRPGDTGAPDIGEFQRQLARFIAANQVRAEKVSVALDTAILFINSLPIEQGLTRTEINDHVRWELSQYYPDTDPAEFITDVHILAEKSNGPHNEAQSVSVRRHDAALIHQAVKGMGLDLYIVDADHYAADTALRINYPDTYRKYIALIGVKENRLDISLMRSGSFETYRYVTVGSNQEIIQTFAALARKAPEIHSITAYGPYLDRELLTLIRRGTPILVEALNPLRHIDVAESLRLADHLTVPSYRFAAAVGVALRKD